MKISRRAGVCIALVALFMYAVCVEITTPPAIAKPTSDNIEYLCILGGHVTANDTEPNEFHLSWRTTPTSVVISVPATVRVVAGTAYGPNHQSPTNFTVVNPRRGATITFNTTTDFPGGITEVDTCSQN